MRIPSGALLWVLLACLLGVGGAARAAPIEVRLAVGGKGLFYYLPLTVAESRGYFTEAGLAVEIADFPGGAKALQALVGGSADVVAGSFEHVVNMRARGQALRAFSLIARYPAIVLAVRADFNAYQTPADLAGRVVGLTAPGSSTHLFLNKLLADAGVPSSAVSVLGVGAGASAVAAMRRGEIDALVHLDPVIEELDAAGAIRVVIDTRTEAGAAQIYGGPYHAACLYTTDTYLQQNPDIIRRLAEAQARALRWMAEASNEDIMAAIPPELWQRNRAAYARALAKNRAIWSTDGQLGQSGARNVLETLARFEPFVADANVDVDALMVNPTAAEGD